MVLSRTDTGNEHDMLFLENLLGMASYFPSPFLIPVQEGARVKWLSFGTDWIFGSPSVMVLSRSNFTDFIENGRMIQMSAFERGPVGHWRSIFPLVLVIFLRKNGNIGRFWNFDFVHADFHWWYSPRFLWTTSGPVFTVHSAFPLGILTPETRNLQWLPAMRMVTTSEIMLGCSSHGYSCS